MIFDVIFIKIYKVKSADPIYFAKTILILIQSLMMSSLIKLFFTLTYGTEYIDKLFGSEDLRLIFILPIIPCSILVHFMYTQKRIYLMIDKFNEYSKTQQNIRLFFAISIFLLLFFLNTLIIRILEYN